MVEENSAVEGEVVSDQEVIMRLAAAMKDNTTPTDDKQNVHTFLTNVIYSEDNTKIGNLRDDKDLNELGLPQYTVRGDKQMSLISDKIMGNSFFRDYFIIDAQDTLGTSLSREGFLIRQSTTSTKQVADATKRRKTNKGWFGKSTTEESGGDITK